MTVMTAVKCELNVKINWPVFKYIILYKLQHCDVCNKTFLRGYKKLELFSKYSADPSKAG